MDPAKYYGTDVLLESIKPSQYCGSEWNAVSKEDAFVKIALAFPDFYRIGMSHLGMHILYSIINNHPLSAAERVYLPEPDLAGKLMSKRLPVCSLETGRPLKDFDAVGFSLQSELTYTNLLYLMELGGIRIRSAERTEDEPLIIAGGPGAYNPVPLSPFIDMFLIGDGEEAVIEIAGALAERKKYNRKKSEFLESAAEIKGVYVPVLGEGRKITKRYYTSFSEDSIPLRPVVPFSEVVHDRANIEIMRGCSRGCRFCQAGMIYRPVRERNSRKTAEIALEVLQNTGYEEISFVSLSSCDYTGLQDLLERVSGFTVPRGISISLPSLRLDSFSVEVAGLIAQTKKTGLTFAPEAGTERLRKVINKDFNAEDFINAISRAYENGWRRLKFYFMLGLPTEEEADLEGIIAFCHEALDLAAKFCPPREKGRINLNVTLSAFVPKAQTPFQWAAQSQPEEIREKQDFLKKHAGRRQLKLKFHNIYQGLVEGVIARGDVRIADVIETAYRLGAKLDGWKEYFDYSLWEKAFKENGISLEDELYRERDAGASFAWDFIDAGVSKEFLLNEYTKAAAGLTTPDCRRSCSACGVSDHIECNRTAGNA